MTVGLVIQAVTCQQGFLQSQGPWDKNSFLPSFSNYDDCDKYRACSLVSLQIESNYPLAGHCLCQHAYTPHLAAERLAKASKHRLSFALPKYDKWKTNQCWDAENEQFGPLPAWHMV